ncbi:MAG TPA: DNA topoisomerase IV subunit A [Flexivirga sp.]|uniref:DNA gyrase/topoisomerase IV subunit A n=1 Tax=Flexivirga sp. TaxID=1962927 RepID=UPI002C597443|nr:DNA topoisomerase IV subunit A [Flexivirga sp.]HWC20774.1 DNA topoisomerase IV subunit A [Flexivirga sp.]
MARKKRDETEYIDDAQQNIIDIDVDDEMQAAYLEYAYSVIYSRAIPDARDGLKPVQRRILYAMDEMRLYPDRNHVKSSRVVGEVMGKYHPHGDTAIYDAIVRQAQDFTMRLPLVDGHGNFGSLDNGPAASRYTEVRLAGAALELTRSLGEDTVDFVPNYDESEQQPDVLPAAFPNLLVNGASGIAVGMATNMAPHNLGEVVAAARHLITHPDCSLDDLMKFVPGPDLPCGGRIVGLEGIRDAYLTGRGSFRTRATATIENLTPRRKSIVVTELPYMVGAEKVIERMKDLVQAKKLQGISDVNDLSDMKGMRLVIDVKNGFNPEAVLEALYKHTPMEESFGINNVALVDGRPKTLGLKELLTVYVDFRIDVVRRRTAFRLKKATDRLHLVDGLLIAILDIDEVIQVIRSSDSAGEARGRLMQVFDLSEPQAEYILELQLRRLTKFSRIELEKEQAELREQIAALQAILDDEKLLRKTVSTELADVVKTHGTPRRTVLLEGNGTKAAATAAPLEVSDDPCWVLLSSSGLLARTTDATPLSSDGSRRKHDVVTSRVLATARGDFGVVTSEGRLVRLNAIDLPTLPPTNDAPALAGGAPLAAYIDLAKGEQPLALAPMSDEANGLAIGTANGVVKRVNPDYPSKDSFEVISLKDGDKVVGAVEVVTGEEDLVFVTSDAQLLRYSANLVRPQGRSGGGVAGVKLGAGARTIWFGIVDTSAPAVVVTGAGASGALPGTGPESVKVSPYDEFPAKGRATGGVRCHRFLRGEDELVIAWAGTAPARAASPTGAAVDLPAADGRRDGSGVPTAGQIAAIGGSFPAAPSTD